MRHAVCLTPLAAVSLMLSCGPARADEQALDCKFGARMSYNDNINMQLANPVAATVLTVSPSLSLSNRTELREIAATAAMSANKYVQDARNDTNDYNLGALFKLIGERNQGTLAASSMRNSTLQSELASTGVVTARRQRTQNNMQGSLAHDFDESTVGTATLGATRLRYEKGPGLVDYDDNVATLALTNLPSERTSVTASLLSRDFRTTDGNVRTRADGISLGGQWKYSERLSLGVTVGRQKTRSEQTLTALACVFGGLICVPVSANTHSETRATTYSGTATYLHRRGRLTGNVSRGLTASGTGALLTTDSAGLDYTHAFDDTLSGTIGATATRSAYLYNAAAESRFTNLSSSLNWQVDPWVSVTGGLSRSTQRVSGQTEPTVAHLVFIGINWSFTPIGRSR